MRTLSAPLIAAQRATVRRPYLQTVISDRFASRARLRPTQWYAGAETPGPHGATVPDDASLIRVRVDPSANTLYRQRVTTPTSGSDYTAWTSWRTTTKLCAVASYGATVVAFAVDSATPTQVWTSTSTDYGATWGAFALAFTHTVTINAIGAAVTPSLVLYCTLNNGANLTMRQYSGGAWGAAVTTTEGDLTATGIAVTRAGLVIASGTTPTGDYRITNRTWFGGAWDGAVRVNLTTPATSGIQYLAPFAVDHTGYARFTFRENFTGTGAFDRTAHCLTPYLVASAAYNGWSEPTPLNVTNTYGLALAGNLNGGGVLYLTTPSAVYYHTDAAASSDVTTDVIAADIPDGLFDITPATITLNNATGAYNTPGSGAAAGLTKGARVAVTPTYYNASGSPETGTANTLWLYIDRIDHDFTTQPPTVRLTCRSAWATLAAWRAPRALQWAAATTTIEYIARQLVALVGMTTSLLSPYSTALTTLKPAFTVRPGDDGLSALVRLLQRLPDICRIRPGDIAITNPSAAAASSAAFKWQGDPATHHPIAGATYRDHLSHQAHVRIVGGTTAATIGDNIDYTEAGLSYFGPHVTADRELAAAADALARADAIARREAIGVATPPGTLDEIIAPVHAGLEILDLIDITDARIGLAAANRRVLRSRIRYSRGAKPTYEHTITLGAP